MTILEQSTSDAGAVHPNATAYSWYVCVVMMLTLAFNFMDRSVIAILVAPIKHEFDISDTGIGLLQGAAFAVFYILFLFPLARLADRGNRRNLLLAGVIVWCAATICCGLARNVPELFGARVLVAIGEAVGMPCAVSMLADYFPPLQRTRAMSVYSIGVFLGAALALGAGGALLRFLRVSIGSVPAFGITPWRGVFIAVGLLGLLLVPLLLLVVEPARLSDDGRAAEVPSNLDQFIQELLRKRTAVISTVLGFAFVSMAGQTLQAWTPTLFVRAHGWDIGIVGLRLGLMTLFFGPVGALSGGVLADWLAKREVFDAKSVVGGTAAFASVIAGVTLTLRSAPAALSAAAALYFLVAFTYGLSQAAIADLMPNRMRAQASAMYITANQLLAATLGPLMIGVLDDRVFHDPAKIALSMRIAVPIAFAIAGSLLWWGRSDVRRLVRQQRRAPAGGREA